jgi:hypothetical protein
VLRFSTAFHRPPKRLAQVVATKHDVMLVLTYAKKAQEFKPQWHQTSSSDWQPEIGPCAVLSAVTVPSSLVSLV